MASTSCTQIGNCNFIVANRPAVLQADFVTYCIYADMPPFCIQSPGGLPTSESGIWNCNLCGNDRPYMVPWTPDENGFVYFQFQEHDYRSVDWKNPTYGWKGSGGTDQLCILYKDDGCTNDWEEVAVFADGSIEGWCAVDVDQKFNYQVLKLTLDGLYLENCCVKFKFAFFNNDSGIPYKTYYSEAYDVNEVVCFDTVKLEGIYDDFDCEGFYYREPGAAIGTWTGGLEDAIYRNVLGVYGKMAQIAFEYAVTRSDFGVPASTVHGKVYELRGRTVPPFVAAQLGRIYGAKRIIIDDEEIDYFYKDAAFNKQIENSRMWRLRPQFSTKKCQLFFGCVAN